MGLGETATASLTAVGIVIVGGYWLLAVAVALLIRWLQGSWRAAGLAFAAFAAVGALMMWVGGARSRADNRLRSAAYAVADPLWHELGVESPRDFDGPQVEGCGDGTVAEVDTVVEVEHPRSGAVPVTTITGRLRAEGWNVTELVDPETDRRWVYAARGDDTIIVRPLSSPPGPPPPDDPIAVTVRLGDCHLLSAPPGAVEHPACAAGRSWMNCLDGDRLLGRGAQRERATHSGGRVQAAVATLAAANVA